MEGYDRAVKVLVVGAGPTGLGAAIRFQECGFSDWLLVEAASGPGGLSRTWESNGFKCDIGGHIAFSHFKYFDDVLDQLVGRNDEKAWVHHERLAYVVVDKDLFVNYPFQNNVGMLPDADRDEAIRGLLENPYENIEPRNFDEWLLKYNGPGICDIFLRPYNQKIWGVATTDMNCDWVKDRVAAPSKVRVVLNALHGRSDGSWGPNATFRYPARGGTGAIYEAIAEHLPDQQVEYDTAVVSIDVDAKIAVLKKGESIERVLYDHVVSTMPLDVLLAMTGREVPHEIRYSSTHVVLVGIRGTCPIRAASWMYFPGDAVPFYRATVFSRYAADLAPPGCYSLLLEVSETASRPVDASVAERCVAACRDLGFVEGEVVEVAHKRFERGYPTPTIGLHAVVGDVLRELRASGIYSRGRFGTYFYSISNQDTAMMQGVQAASHILHGSTETCLELRNWTTSRYDETNFRGIFRKVPHVDAIKEHLERKRCIHCGLPRPSIYARSVCMHCLPDYCRGNRSFEEDSISVDSWTSS